MAMLRRKLYSSKAIWACHVDNKTLICSNIDAIPSKIDENAVFSLRL